MKPTEADLRELLSSWMTKSAIIAGEHSGNVVNAYRRVIHNGKV